MARRSLAVRSRCLHRTLLVMLIATAGGLAARAQPDGALGYDALEIPPLPGQTGVRLLALDDRGTLIGESSFAPATPFIWTNGRSTSLTPPINYTFPRIAGLSPSSGVSVGWGLGDLYTDALVWPPVGEPLVLPPPDWALSAIASDVNDAGWVVGETDFPDTAVLWRDGDATDLGTLPGGRPIAAAYALNAQGEVVGAADNGVEQRPFVWRDGIMTDVGGPPDTDAGAAQSINDLGEIAGYVGRDGFVHAFNRTVRLPDLDASCNGITRAYGISTPGLVVGRSSRRGDCFEGHAVIWEGDGRGNFEVWDVVEDLSLRGIPSSLMLFEATDINVAGQVIANGEDDLTGEARGVLLTPFHFTIEPPVPGRAGERNTIRMSDLAPGEAVVLVWGFDRGASRAGTRCPGAPLQMGAVRGYLGPIMADLTGVAVVDTIIPLAGRGQTVRMQGLAPGRCVVSQVIETTLQ